MNEMYIMTLGIHFLGAVFVFGTIVLNLLMLNIAKDLKSYKRLMSIFLMPLSATMIALAIFTGVVMMAAKHLDFTIENIVMIIISLALIVLEAKRGKYLKYMPLKQENGLNIYRAFGSKILYIELALVVAISIWMWII